MAGRLNTTISNDNAVRLALAARRPGVTKTEIVDNALTLFFTPERDDYRDAAILRRLDRLTRQFDRLQRDGRIIAETLALFIRYYLSITPPLPDSDQDAARAQGRARFEMFVEQLTRRLAGGGSLINDVLEEITPKADQFFTEDEINAERLDEEDTPPWEEAPSDG